MTEKERIEYVASELRRIAKGARRATPIDAPTLSDGLRALADLLEMDDSTPPPEVPAAEGWPRVIKDDERGGA